MLMSSPRHRECLPWCQATLRKSSCNQHPKPDQWWRGAAYTLVVPNHGKRRNPHSAWHVPASFENPACPETLSRLAGLDRLIFFRYPTKSHPTLNIAATPTFCALILQSGLSIQTKAPTPRTCYSKVKKRPCCGIYTARSSIELAPRELHYARGRLDPRSNRPMDIIMHGARIRIRLAGRRLQPRD
jgi:hypothetical protein